MGMSNNKKRCISKFIEQTDTMYLSFMATGDEQSELTSVYLYDPDKTIIYKMEEAEEGEYKAETTKQGQYMLCIHPASEKPHFVSFEFYTKYERGHTLNLAKDENIHDMKNDVAEISLLFEEMENNVRFISDRRNKHNILTGEFVESIKHITVFKIVVIFFVSLLQIWLIKRFYINSRKVNNPYYETGL
jgi:hypothetical protein